MTVLNRTAKSFLLQELLSGMWLTLHLRLPAEGDHQLPL